ESLPERVAERLDLARAADPVLEQQGQLVAVAGIDRARGAAEQVGEELGLTPPETHGRLSDAPPGLLEILGPELRLVLVTPLRPQGIRARLEADQGRARGLLQRRPGLALEVAHRGLEGLSDLVHPALGDILGFEPQAFALALE